MTFLSTECGKCTPLQTSFLEDLRKQLEVFKTIGSPGDSFVEEAIREYVRKFIYAGSTDSLEHLHEHIEQLYETEKLISNPDLLDKAKELSLEASSLKKSTLLKIGRFSSDSLVNDEKLATLFLKRLVYNASICSLGVNKCTVSNFQEFFKAQRFQSFREISLSHSSQEPYLISVGSDSTYYIAFRSEPDITGWARKYKSFGEGMPI